MEKAKKLEIKKAIERINALYERGQVKEVLAKGYDEDGVLRVVHNAWEFSQPCVIAAQRAGFSVIKTFRDKAGVSSFIAHAPNFNFISGEKAEVIKGGLNPVFLKEATK